MGLEAPPGLANFQEYWPGRGRTLNPTGKRQQTRWMRPELPDSDPTRRCPLQAGNGQKGCRDRGKRGYERYVALGALGRNLQTLGPAARQGQAGLPSRQVQTQA